MPSTQRTTRAFTVTPLYRVKQIKTTLRRHYAYGHGLRRLANHLVPRADHEGHCAAQLHVDLHTAVVYQLSRAARRVVLRQPAGLRNRDEKKATHRPVTRTLGGKGRAASSSGMSRTSPWRNVTCMETSKPCDAISGLRHLRDLYYGTRRGSWGIEAALWSAVKPVMHRMLPAAANN